MALRADWNVYGSDDENPINVLVRRMKIPLGFGIGSGIALQAATGVLETPATFGRIACTTLPMCGIGFYYLTGSYIAERIRGKSGACNNMIGVYCTFPLVRKYLTLTKTVLVMGMITLPVYAMARGLQPKNYMDVTEGMIYGVHMCACDINLLLQKKPSEPFVKRDSYNPFTFPSE